jgi:hypothetical protein
MSVPWRTAERGQSGWRSRPSPRVFARTDNSGCGLAARGPAVPTRGPGWRRARWGPHVRIGFGMAMIGTGSILIGRAEPSFALLILLSARCRCPARARSESAASAGYEDEIDEGEEHRADAPRARRGWRSGRIRVLAPFTARGPSQVVHYSTGADGSLFNRHAESARYGAM